MEPRWWRHAQPGKQAGWQAGRLANAARQREGRRRGRREAEGRHRDARRVGEVCDELTHLLERVGLHEDVVLGEEERGNLAELAHGGRVGVGDDISEQIAGNQGVNC